MRTLAAKAWRWLVWRMRDQRDGWHAPGDRERLEHVGKLLAQSCPECRCSNLLELLRGEIVWCAMCGASYSPDDFVVASERNRRTYEAAS